MIAFVAGAAVASEQFDGGRPSTAGDLIQQIHGEKGDLKRREKLDEEDLDAWQDRYNEAMQDAIAGSGCDRDGAGYAKCLCKSLRKVRLPRPPRTKGMISSYKVKWPISTDRVLAFKISQTGKVRRCKSAARPVPK